MRCEFGSRVAARGGGTDLKELLMNRAFLILTVASLSSIGGVLAQEQTPPDERGPSVARLSIIDGDVSIRRGDSGDVVAGGINAPLTAQDRVLTASSSR